jgi:uncharacterized 2Fe-2S/4Fe-4S cluster protein (DUF4445 family)
MTDHLVLFMPSGKRGRFPTDTPVLDAARQLGVHVESVCGGRGICGRCQVDVQEGVFAKHGITSSNEHISPFGGNEVRYAEKRDLKAGRRLSCSARILGDLVIDIPQDAVVNAQVVRKDSDGRIIERNPAIHMCYVEVEEPDMHKPLGDLDRLLMAIEADWGFKGLAIDAYLYGQVQQVLRKGDWKVTAAVHEPVDGGPATLIALYPGLKNEAYGIACDIGSTTIAMHLSSLLSGRTLASSGTSNPQIRFGEDLMSRVSYVMMNPGGREGMTRPCARSSADRQGLPRKAGSNAAIFSTAVFVGNPIMHHLLLGIDPTELGGAPFALAVSGAVNVKSSRDRPPTQPRRAGLYAALHRRPCRRRRRRRDAVRRPAPPGRDDAAGRCRHQCRDRARQLEPVRRRSSPTGPPSRARRSPAASAPPPAPSSGSASIRKRWSRASRSSASSLVGRSRLCRGREGRSASPASAAPASSRHRRDVPRGYHHRGWRHQRRGRPQPADRPGNGRTFSYLLRDGEPRLMVTQTDVRAIQLAKAALYAGVKLLMDKLGIDHVDRIGLAGAFGSLHRSQIRHGPRPDPDCDLEKVKAVGNAAGTGARMALLNRSHRREIEQTVPGSRRSRPRWNRNSRSISSTPWLFPTRSTPSRG